MQGSFSRVRTQATCVSSKASIPMEGGASSAGAEDGRWRRSLLGYVYSFTAMPSVFILRYRWLRSKPRTSAVRVTLPWFSSSFLRI